jgi:hypothetical protein
VHNVRAKSKEIKVKVINAIQITTIFGFWPLLIAWLLMSNFPGAATLFAMSVALYSFAFPIIVCLIYEGIKDI